MSKIRIMCTSTGCIEYAPVRYRNLGIDIIRPHMIFEGKEYLEGIGLGPEEFYEKLEKLENPKNNLPKTSVPSPLEIAEHFDKAIEEGYDEAIVFSISTGLGGTYNAICLVAKDYQEKLKIHVINTKVTSFVEGLLAVKAQEMVNAGMTSEQILKEIAWMMKTHNFIGIDAKLDYLIYNGRLKGGKAFIGQMLKICPIISFDENGDCVPIENIRTPKKALMRTCEIIKEKLGDRSPEDYILFHVYTGPSVLEQLISIEENYGIKTNHEDVILSPVSGCHNGPWLAGYGILFLRREDEPLED